MSPFNVGLPIKLPEFGWAGAGELVRHGQRWSSGRARDTKLYLLAMVGGHPYLVRVALYHLAREVNSQQATTRSLHWREFIATIYGITLQICKHIRS